MRRVVASVAALIAVTRALSTRPGSALTLTSTSWPDSDERDFVFRHLRLQPHGGQVGDDVERVAGVVAHILARTDLARDDSAVDRRMDRRRAPHRALLLQGGDLVVGEADDALAATRVASSDISAERMSFWAPTSCALRLLIFLERRGLAFVQILEPLLDDAREIELRARLVHGA